MAENVIKSLELMGKGMAAIFLVIMVIYGGVALLLKLGSGPEKLDAPVPGGGAETDEAPIPDRGRLLAAVAATVSEYEGTDVSGFRIVSLKRKGRA